MIANTDFPETDQEGILRRKFLGKMMAVGGLGLILGKLMPKAVHAAVDEKYTNNMPNVKTSIPGSCCMPAATFSR